MEEKLNTDINDVEVIFSELEENVVEIESNNSGVDVVTLMLMVVEYI